ncbi:MAG: hypothetical protein KDA87_11965, partial [Planctomycetales bacterium]|nr:hypothetical protein [Planctomycetales bacterium]
MPQGTKIRGNPVANQGRMVVIGMVVVALAAAIFAWTFRLSQGQQILTFWGADAASAIRLGSEVKLLQLEAGQIDSSNALVRSLNGMDWTAAIDISKTSGLVHARQALITDASYAWSSEANADWSKDWDVLLFAGPDQRITVAVQGEAQILVHGGTGRMVQ